MSDAYHSDFTHVSKTMLNLFLESRREYYHTYIERTMPPRVATKPMLAGQILHAMLLEDKPFDDLVLQYPASCLNINGDLVGKSAALFRQKYDSFICLKESECEAVRAVVDGVLKDKRLGEILTQATDRERRRDAVIEGLACRCKPDIVCDVGSHVAAYDLKFSEQVDPDSWRRASRRLRYWLQDSHYSAVLASHYRKPVMFRFILVEVQFPFRVQWKWYDPHSREEASEAHRRTLRELAECHATGDWSDRWANETVLEPWDVGQDEMVEVQQ